MNITLMMATYNRLDLTKRMIDNLFENTKLPFNLAIIDNGSEDGTLNYLTKLVPRGTQKGINIYLKPNYQNRGIAIARNQGLNIANDLDTDFYCTIDNDVEVPDGWLAECIDILKANRSYGMIGVNMEGTEYPLVTCNEHIFQNKPEGNLGTACIVFPKSTHKLLGYFNTVDYSKFYGLEDSEYGMRCRFIGLKLGYIQRMGVHFGVGELDTGEYREFKTKEHDSYVKKFKENCALFANRKKSIYMPYKD